MTQELTPSQRKWYDLAASHADTFAQRAAEYDLEGKFPFENYAEMKESGYSSMPIPADCNGGGADLLDICIAQNRLAQGDGATALAVNMHFGLPFVMTDLIALGDDGPKELLTKIADEQLIVFGAITDPQVDSYKGITGLGYTTVEAVKEGDKFRVNGRKGFGTNSPIGDLFGCTAVYDDPDDGEVGLIFVLPSDTEGLVCLNDWDTMGMRASQSHSWRLEDVFVEEDHVFKHNLWEWDKFARACGPGTAAPSAPSTWESRKRRGILPSTRPGTAPVCPSSTPKATTQATSSWLQRWTSPCMRAGPGRRASPSA